MEIEKVFVDEMVAHAREDAPNECCGIIAGKNRRPAKLFRAINAEASPYRYNVDPKDLFRIHRECDENGWQFLILYHSHTASQAYPSPTDIRLAYWPECYYAIVSLQDPERPLVRAFRILEGDVNEEQLQIT